VDFVFSSQKRKEKSFLRATFSSQNRAICKKQNFIMASSDMKEFKKKMHLKKLYPKTGF
jgi:hypothetical protein